MKGVSKVSLYDFMQFATMTEQLKKQEREEKLSELEERKTYGLISDWEYDYEKSKIENDF